MKKIILAIFTIMLTLAIFGYGKTASDSGGGSSGGGGPAPSAVKFIIRTNDTGNFTTLDNDGNVIGTIAVPAEYTALSNPIADHDSFMYIYKDTNNDYHLQLGTFDSNEQIELLTGNASTVWGTDVDNKFSGPNHNFFVRGDNGYDSSICDTLQMYHPFNFFYVSDWFGADWLDEDTVIYADFDSIKKINKNGSNVTSYGKSLNTNHAIAVSPDKSKVICGNSSNSGVQIYSLSSDFSTLTDYQAVVYPVEVSGGRITRALWIDNNTAVVVIKANGGAMYLYRIDSSPTITEVTPVVDNGYYYNLAYSVSDQRLYFHNAIGGQLYSVPLSGGARTLVYSGDSGVDGFALRN
ncbi:MAG: hypothetical protein LBL50_01665 [Candidatus Margulisbacteria bacterium]|jgi:hypothetical protein|nr:hypothetical protein [Candidatus Margulisiibacteriota bacterium]